MEIDNIPLVIFPLAKWDSPYSSTTFSLAKEFSKSHKVLYIDAPTTLKDVIFNFNRKNIKLRIQRMLKGHFLESYNDNLTICYLTFAIPINFLPKRSLMYFKLKSFNEKLIFNSLQRRLKKLDLKEYIYLNIFNSFYNHRKYLSPYLDIYYTVDNISKSAHIDKHGTYIEKEYIKQSDLNFGTSEMLVKNNKKYNDNFYYLPNAADLTIFNPKLKYDIPKDLADINNKIITFTGHLDKRNDIDLLHSILDYHSDKTLVIVGLVSLKKEVLNRLKAYPNIVFVSPKPLKELPAFLYYSDCAIIPFKNNELTNSIYPLKINEYLAMGIPVVSTNFSTDIQNFKDVVTLTNDYLEFNQSINLEIEENSIAKRVNRTNAAFTNTWENRAKQFWSIIHSHSK